MNYIKLTLLLALFSGLSHAGNEGGGGIVVACYKDGNLTKVELLDLYEGKAKGFEYYELTGDFNTDLEAISSKIKKDPEEARQFAFNVSRRVKTYKFIPEDAELELTNDALPVFLPKGCKAKQVANYYNHHLIWVDSVLFNKMSYRDQLALAVHEFIYSLERNYYVPDSRYARLITSLAFSVEDPFKSPSRKGTFNCMSADLSRSVVMFTATKVQSSDQNQWLFDFKVLNGHMIYSRKSAIFGISKNSILGNYPDGSSEPRYSVSGLSSQINRNEGMVVYSSATRLHLSWEGSDPGDKFFEVDVSCSPSVDP